MKPESVKTHVGRLPHLQLRDARVLHDLILHHNLSSILQLGMQHGVSTAYLAGSLHELGFGSLTVIDAGHAIERRERVEQLLITAGLRQLVTFQFQAHSLHWQLARLLEENSQPAFDLCFISTVHTWVDIGFAFFLARQLLRPGGWIVFDDLPHTFALGSRTASRHVERMTDEERYLPQVQQVFSLLVLPDPALDTFRRIRRLGIARLRLPSTSLTSSLIETALFEGMHLARIDPEFRAFLLRRPASALAEISGLPESLFRHLRLAESGLWSPRGAVVDPPITTHFLEHPEWSSPITETSLLAMLEA